MGLNYNRRRYETREARGFGKEAAAQVVVKRSKGQKGDEKLIVGLCLGGGEEGRREEGKEGKTSGGKEGRRRR